MTLGRDTGGQPRLFGGDALIVVGTEHKGHWNKRPLLPAERAFCPLAEFRDCGSIFFFFFFHSGHIDISTDHCGKRLRVLRNEIEIHMICN